MSQGKIEPLIYAAIEQLAEIYAFNTERMIEAAIAPLAAEIAQLRQEVGLLRERDTPGTSAEPQKEITN